MKKSTLLGQTNLANHSTLTIRLIYPAGRPPLCEIEWPEHSTVTSVNGFDAVIAQVMRTLAVASVALGQSPESVET